MNGLTPKDRLDEALKRYRRVAPGKRKRALRDVDAAYLAFRKAETGELYPEDAASRKRGLLGDLLREQNQHARSRLLRELKDTYTRLHGIETHTRRAGVSLSRFLFSIRLYWALIGALIGVTALTFLSGPIKQVVAGWVLLLLVAGIVPLAIRQWRERPEGADLNFLIRWLPGLYFLGLAAMVLGPLIVPQGYVFALDSVWGPEYFSGVRGVDVPPSHLPLHALVIVLRTLLGPPLAQTVFLLGILALAGWAMYRFAGGQRAVARYFAGTFYVFNPFVYDRLLAGHWTLLLGYALLPLALQAAVHWLRRPTFRRSLILAAWWSVLTAASVHFLYIFGLVILTLLILGLFRTERGILATRWATIALTYGVINLYWLIPAVGVADAFTHVDTSHLSVFSTKPVIADSPWLSVVWLRGFFAPQGTSPEAAVPLAPVLFLGLLVLVGFGIAYAVRRRPRRETILLLLTASYLAIPLAVGVAGLGAQQLYQWLFEVVPGFVMMREPQKFAMLLVPLFAVAGGYGLAELTQRIRSAGKRILVITVAFGLVLSQAAPLVWGAGGQLRRAEYPQGWQRIRELTKNAEEGKMLVLPWRQYVYLSFAYPDRVIANPAPVVFPQPTVVSQKMDIARVSEPPEGPLDQLAERLGRGNIIRNADYDLLRREGVRWLVVISTVRGRGELGGIERSADIELVYGDEDIQLFELTRR